MSKLRKMIGIVLLAAIASLGVPVVLADTGPVESPGITSDGPVESPGVVGPVESPGIAADLATYLASTFIL
jgi:hypothetical protein